MDATTAAELASALTLLKQVDGQDDTDDHSEVMGNEFSFGGRQPEKGAEACDHSDEVCAKIVPDAVEQTSGKDCIIEPTKQLVMQLTQLEARCNLTGDKIAAAMTKTIKNTALDVANRAAAAMAKPASENGWEASPASWEASERLDSLARELSDLQQRFIATTAGKDAESRRADFWVQRAEALRQQVSGLESESQEQQSFGSASVQKLRFLLTGGTPETSEELALLEWLRSVEARAFQAETERDHAMQQLTVVEKELIERLTRDTSDLKTKLDAALEEVSEKKRQLEEQQLQFANERTTFWEEMEAARMIQAKMAGHCIHPDTGSTEAHGRTSSPSQAAPESCESSQPILCANESDVPLLTCGKPGQQSKDFDDQVSLTPRASLTPTPSLVVTNDLGVSMAGRPWGSAEAPVRRLWSSDAQGPPGTRMSTGSHTIPARIVPPSVVSPRVPLRSSEPWAALTPQLTPRLQPLQNLHSPRTLERSAPRPCSPSTRAPATSPRSTLLSPRPINHLTGPPTTNGSQAGFSARATLPAPQGNSLEVRVGGSNMPTAMAAPHGQRAVSGGGSLVSGHHRPLAPASASDTGPASVPSPWISVGQAAREQVKVQPAGHSAHVPPAVNMVAANMRLMQKPGSVSFPMPGTTTQPLGMRLSGGMSPIHG